MRLSPSLLCGPKKLGNQLTARYQALSRTAVARDVLVLSSTRPHRADGADYSKQADSSFMALRALQKEANMDGTWKRIPTANVCDRCLQRISVRDM